MKQLIKESVGETTGGDNVRVTFISGNKKFTPDKNKGNLLFTIYEKTLLNTHCFTGCCVKRSTSYYFNMASLIFILSVGLLIIGVSFLLTGHTLIKNIILQTMALNPDSTRLNSWLKPPVQAHLEGNYDVFLIT